MEFFRKRNGYISVIDIATAMVAPHVQRSTPMDEEWQHVSGFLHELKSGGYLLVEGEGNDIYHEKFSSTPDRVKKYFSKDEIQDYSDLTKRSDEELAEIVRKNDNAYVSGSLHNRALTEIEMRHKKKIENLLEARQENTKPRGKTIKKDFETPEVFIQSRVQENEEDHHILMGERANASNKAHMIVDGKDGSVRLEDGRQEPTEIAPRIETIITLKGKKIRTTREVLEEIPDEKQGGLVVEIEKIKGSSGSSRTKEGVADNITVNISLLIKNFSRRKVTLRNMQVHLDVPDCYTASQFFTEIKPQEIVDTENVITRNSCFSISIAGRHNGGAGHQNPLWVENHNRILSDTSSFSFTVRVMGESISIDGNMAISGTFDITQDIVPSLKTS